MASAVSSVDQIQNQLNELLHKLGEVDRQITSVQTEFEVKRDALQKQYETDIKPLQERRQELYSLISALGESNRSILLAGQRTKEVALPAGKLSWRKPRSGITFLAEEKEILAFLAKHNFSALVVRIKREIMKSKIAKQPKIQAALEAAGLIRVGNGEEKLYIEPLVVELDTPSQQPQAANANGPRELPSGIPGQGH